MTVMTPLSTVNLTTSFIGIQNVVPSFIWMTRRTFASGSPGLASGGLGSGGVAVGLEVGVVLDFAVLPTADAGGPDFLTAFGALVGSLSTGSGFGGSSTVTVAFSFARIVVLVVSAGFFAGGVLGFVTFAVAGSAAAAGSGFVVDFAIA